MNIEQTVEAQRKFFSTGRTFDIKFRLEALDKLKQAIKKHETELLEAIKKGAIKKEKAKKSSKEPAFIYKIITIFLHN